MSSVASSEPSAPSAISARASGPESAQRIVVVGNGPVGFRFLRGLTEQSERSHHDIVVFGEEPLVAYDRINLTASLDEEFSGSLEYEPRAWYEQNGIRLHTDDPIVEIDRQAQSVRSRSGVTVSYDQLVLATGSRAFMPPISGIDQPRVHAYRTLADLERIRADAASARRAVVLGGGLLGLEAAHALTKLGLTVFVVERASVLMPRQLDNAGAARLKKLLESTRMTVLLQRQTEKIAPLDDHLHVQFTNGEGIVADMVVVAAGIRPCDELAHACGLAIGQRGGIIIDDHLQTDDPAIFAIGECAVHNGTVYGLAAPGFQMASTLADRLHGREAAFHGSHEATRLKLVGVDVTFVGDYLDTSNGEVLVDEQADSYAKLIVAGGRLVGMIGVGDVPQQQRLKEAIDQKRRIWWWHRRRFERTGRLWTGEDKVSVTDWPPSAVVCSCTGVTRGQLTTACDQGCRTVAALAAATGASTVCGSCLPLVSRFTDETSWTESESVKHRLVAAVSIIAAALLVLLILAPPIGPPISVQTAWSVWDVLIRDVFWKQVTGYSMLALAVLSLVISVRKRTSLLRRLEFGSLRLLHVCLAACALALLIAHTGFHRGSHLNFFLFCTFLVASGTGSVVGLLAGLEARLSPQLRRLRRPATLLHILVLWPLPLLVAFHIVAVYWL